MLDEYCGRRKTVNKHESGTDRNYSGKMRLDAKLMYK